MKFLSNKKISTQFNIIIIFCMLLISIMQASFILYTNTVFANRLKENANATMEQVKNVLKNNLENAKNVASIAYYADVIQKSLKEESIYTKFQLKAEAEKLFAFVKVGNYTVEDIFIADSEGMVMSIDDSIASSKHKEIFDKYNLLEINESVIVTDAAPPFRYCFAMPVYDTDVGAPFRKKIGVIAVFCNFRSISDLINEESISQNDTFLLLDGDDSVVLSNRRELVGTKYVNEKFDREYGKNSLRLEAEISKYNWRTVSFTSNLNQQNEFTIFLVELIALWLVCILLFVLVYYVINNSIANPLSNMSREIGSICDKNIKQRMNVRPGGELSVIAENINIMLDKIETMTYNIVATQKRLYEAELAMKQAQISALHSNINPHFLYNTLECIKSIGVVYNSNEIVDISGAMADVFRYSIKEEELVSVEKELLVVRQYMVIMNIRFRDKFELITDVDPDISELRIPKMILQPLVENAVYHGLEGKNGKGVLTISAKHIGNDIIFKISDNGIGISKERVDKLNELLTNDLFSNPSNTEFGMGILNVAQKIRLHFGDKCFLRIESEENTGTNIIFKL